MDNAQTKAVGYFQQSWDAIKLYWTAGAGAFKRGWTIAVLAAALTGAGGYILYLNHQNKKAAEEVIKAEEQMKDAQEQSIRLINQTNELIKLNEDNQKVLQQLQEDKKRIEQLTETFNAKMKENTNALTKIGSQVSQLEDGDVAPVLKETVKQIQFLRSAKMQVIKDKNIKW